MFMCSVACRLLSKQITSKYKQMSQTVISQSNCRIFTHLPAWEACTSCSAWRSLVNGNSCLELPLNKVRERLNNISSFLKYTQAWRLNEK